MARVDPEKSWRTRLAVLLAAPILSLLSWPAAAAAVENVDLKLVIATDVSRSIDADEARLQRQGTVMAFRSPKVIAAIQGGALGRIAVLYLDFSSESFDRVVIDWRIIHDAASANAFADELIKAPPTFGMRTSISSAIDMGAQLLTSSTTIKAPQQSIDISGDGPNNYGRRVTDARDEAVAKGITINGLPIMDNKNPYGFNYVPNLDRYYRDCVAGGRGSFVLKATTFADFAKAIEHKLVMEISDNVPMRPRDEGRVIKVSSLRRPAQFNLPDVAPGSERNRIEGYEGNCDFGRFGG